MSWILFYKLFLLLPFTEEAKEDAKLEREVATALPTSEERKDMNDLADLADDMGKMTADNKVNDSLDVWDKGVKLVEKLEELLKDLKPTPSLPYLVVKYLLKPWMSAFRKIIKAKKGTFSTIKVYYHLKNAILRAAMSGLKHISGKYWPKSNILCTMRK